jgi:RNA polymerase sigma-70 factor (ECF subfamily)
MTTNLDRLPDAELARACREAGSAPHFEELVRRYQAKVFHFLRHKTPTVQDAEDLTQQTFIRAYRNLHRYNPAYRFVTWLFTIARRQAASFYRSRRPLPELSEDDYDSRDPSAILSDREGEQDLWRWAQRTLRDRPFTALWLDIREDMTIREISKAMGLTQTHVKVLLHRARRTLMQSYRDTRAGATDTHPVGGARRAPAGRAQASTIETARSMP